MATTFAIGAGGTVAAQDVKTAGCVLCINTRRVRAGAYTGVEFEETDMKPGIQSECAYADVRWMSKFPDEQEWLRIPIYDSVVPTIDDEKGFAARTARVLGAAGQLQSMWTISTWHGNQRS